MTIEILCSFEIYTYISYPLATSTVLQDHVGEEIVLCLYSRKGIFTTRYIDETFSIVSIVNTQYPV